MNPKIHNYHDILAFSLEIDVPPRVIPVIVIKSENTDNIRQQLLNLQHSRRKDSLNDRWMRWLCDMVLDDFIDDRQSVCGRTYERDQSCGIVFSIIRNDGKDPRSFLANISHEMMHATNIIWGAAGHRHSHKKDEPHAYLLEHLVLNTLVALEQAKILEINLHIQ